MIQHIYRVEMVGGLHDGKRFETIAQEENELPGVVCYPTWTTEEEIIPYEDANVFHAYKKTDSIREEEDTIIRYEYAGLAKMPIV